jgi:CRP/FNR family transcriptional regulator, dissimilatory nitrate respiration regulator
VKVLHASMTAFNLDILPANLRNAMFYQDLAAGEILFAQNDPATAIFAVESGRVSLIHYTEAGKTINHYSVMAGEYFAEVALFNEVYVCTVIAEIPSRIVSFPKQLFLTALGQDPELAIAFIEQLVRRLHYTKILLELRGIRSARERVLHYLRVMAPPNEKTVSLDRPLKQIAGDIGISPEVFSRTLTQLQNERLITRVRRKITLND